MKRRKLVVLFAVVSTVATGLSSAARPAAAEEKPAEFIDALIQAGYHEYAELYLEQVKKRSPDDPVFAAARPPAVFLEAVVQVAGANSQTDAEKRTEGLRRALAKYEECLKSDDENLQPHKVRMGMAGVYVTLSRLKMAQAVLAVEDKQAYRKEAQNLLEKARNEVKKAEQEIKRRLIEIQQQGTITPESKLWSVRDAYRRDYLQARLTLAAIAVDVAETHEKDSPEYKREIKKAAREYGVLFEKYSTRIAGIYARVKQGECLQKAGDHEAALKCFSDVNEQRDDMPALRRVKLMSIRRSMQSWLALEKHDAMIKCAEKTKLTNREKATNDGAGIMYYHAKALLEKGAKGPGAGRARAKVWAVKLLEEASKYDTEFKELIDKELGLPPDPCTDLLKRADEARLGWQKARGAGRPEEAAKHRHEAIKLYRSRWQTPCDADGPERMATILYYLCYLYYDAGDYSKAAIAGATLARKYPDSRFARGAAKIALASWQRKTKAVEAAGGAAAAGFERRQLFDIAGLVADRWPQSPGAAEALILLIGDAMKSEDIDSVMGLLDRIPESSPRRGEADLWVGQWLWSIYAQAVQNERAPDEAAKKN